MTGKKAVLILSATLLLAVLASCGVGSVDTPKSGSSDANQAQLLSISITPDNPTIAKSTAQQFTATGFYSDNTTRDLTASVTWGSSDTNVSAVGDSIAAAADILMAPKTTSGGKAYAYGKNSGTTTVTATSGSTSGSTTLTVTNATLVSLSVTPANPSITSGTAQQFIATGTFSDNTTQDLTTQVAWSSSDTAVATIDASGSASSIAAGSTTVTASSGTISGSTTLTVTAPAVPTTGSATLAWSASTTNTDGTAASIAGYKVYYGTSSGNYTTILDIGNVTTYTVNNLSPGTYFFTVTAYDSSRTESGYSNEASKTIQ